MSNDGRDRGGGGESAALISHLEDVLGIRRGSNIQCSAFTAGGDELDVESHLLGHGRGCEVPSLEHSATNRLDTSNLIPEPLVGSIGVVGAHGRDDAALRCLYRNGHRRREQCGDKCERHKTRCSCTAHDAPLRNGLVVASGFLPTLCPAPGAQHPQHITRGLLCFGYLIHCLRPPTSRPRPWLLIRPRCCRSPLRTISASTNPAR